MNLRLILIIVAIITLLSSCNRTDSKGPKIDESKLVNMEVNIHRYGKSLFELDTNNFQNEVRKIKDEFTLFLGNDIEDPKKLAPLYRFITDTSLIAIGNEAINCYPDLQKIEKQLGNAFSRYNYFFPNFKKPTVYSYISNLYYENPVIIDDSVIIIALDVYLGSEFTKYRSLGLPNYKIRCMTSDYIVIDVMKELYSSNLDKHFKQKTLIDRMINSGKLLYYLDAIMPDTPDSLKIGYTKNQINWINSNKQKVWAFLVKNKLFYTADYKIQNNFTKDAPFTSGFSNESPPRIGMWLGWQIVREYMDKHPNVSLNTLINNSDSQKIFNQSGYKP